MSEVQEPYHDDHEAGRQQQQQQLASSNQQEMSTSPKQTAHKRKRDSIDHGEKDDGREGTEGSTGSRRTSFKQTSPNMSSTTAFMPINPNAPLPNQANQYAYQSLNVSQQNGSSASQNAANAALAAEAMSGLLPQLAGTQSSMSGYGSESQSKPGEHAQMDTSFQMSPQPMEGHTEGVGGARHVPARPTSHSVSQPATTPNPKPQVGTEEWHRVRRDNHKEVERRRRETINEGINELAKIVPGCEKNKGSILQRAVQYIQEIKDHESQNIEKWTLEKLLTEQAIQELSQSNEKLKKECERAWREAETWKQSCLQAGITREGGGQSGSS